MNTDAHDKQLQELRGGICDTQRAKHNSSWHQLPEAGWLLGKRKDEESQSIKFPKRGRTGRDWSPGHQRQLGSCEGHITVTEWLEPCLVTLGVQWPPLTWCEDGPVLLGREEFLAWEWSSAKSDVTFTMVVSCGGQLWLSAVAASCGSHCYGNHSIQCGQLSWPLWWAGIVLIVMVICSGHWYGQL